jgi:ribosome modulation factor
MRVDVQILELGAETMNTEEKWAVHCVALGRRDARAGRSICDCPFRDWQDSGYWLMGFASQIEDRLSGLGFKKVSVYVR